MPNARILGTGHYAPERVVTNDELSKTVDTSDAWIFPRTGIRQRHLAAEGETSSDMATKAAQEALKMAGKTPEEVDLLIITTVTPDQKLPSCAAFVQKKLGAVNAGAFDLVAACAGSIYGLSVATQFVRTGAAKCVVVVGVELLSSILDWEDRNTCVLFGDAAGAMVIGPSEEPSILYSKMYMDGSLTEILKIPGGGSVHPPSHQAVDDKLHLVKMNGREVYKVAVRNLVDSLKEALRASDLTVEDVNWVTAHQANIRIIETVMDRLEIPREKAILNIDRYGNTSSASVPMTLDEGVRDGRIQKGDLVAMVAIGAGIAWGAALVRW